MDKMFRKTKKLLYVFAGFALLLLGLLGLVLPLLPGIVLILLGLIALSRGSTRLYESRYSRRVVKFIKKRVPKRVGSML